MERILVINPGSTSTKIALFEGDKKVLGSSLRHMDEEIAQFAGCLEQEEFREQKVLEWMNDNRIEASSLDCIMARGGALPQVPSGAILVTERMIDYMYHKASRANFHPSNLACIIAYRLAQQAHIPVYVYDAVSTDELTDIARVTGVPQIPRINLGHTLNTRSVAIRCAKEVLHRPFEQCTFIVAHLGGGYSARLLQNGRNVDSVRDDEGAFCPERSGNIAALDLIKYIYENGISYPDAVKLQRGSAGWKALLGTSDARELLDREKAGDAKAALVLDAFCYNVGKDIGKLACAVKGKVDRILLTGGIAFSERITAAITEYVDWIAPVIVSAGEFEMEALAEGGLRILRGEETWREMGEDYRCQ
ncbi:MAG: butyrate kinase [Eubacteriales bacterium]|nr:butyrate kinase [Eubacteriales bacterium]